MEIHVLFFELLQVAIGMRSSLSCIPTAEEWRHLFELSKKQALTAIAFHGFCKLKEYNTVDSGFDPSSGMEELCYFKWLGLTAKTAQRNKAITEGCRELCKELAHDGMSCCILKGQGNLEYYPEELQDSRTAGDIDVWCTPMNPCGLDIAVADLDGNGAHYEKYHGIEAVIEYSLMKARTVGARKPVIR